MDFRAFLEAYYRAKKPAGFSYRAFSRRAGLGAPNYLKLVIDGQRNLTPEMAARFADACSLDGESAQYFLALVEFNQAQDSQARDTAYEKLSGFRRYRKAQRLELAHAAYHANWYVPAVRELVGSGAFREDPEWIASILWPPIKPADAARALETLLELELVVRDEDGKLRQQSTIVSTGAQTAGMHIGNYHREMMRKAADAIDTVPAALRDISSLTLCLDDKALGQLKERLARLRRELLELSHTPGAACQVVQLNLQLFPLTQVVKGESDEGKSQ